MPAYQTVCKLWKIYSLEKQEAASSLIIIPEENREFAPSSVTEGVSLRKNVWRGHRGEESEITTGSTSRIAVGAVKTPRQPVWCRMKDCALSAGSCRVRHLGVTSCRLAFSWLALNRTGLAARVFALSRACVPNVSPAASIGTVPDRTDWQIGWFSLTNAWPG